MAINQHDRIYKMLAEKYKKPVEVIEKICRTQAEFTAKVIESGSKYSVRWKYFGIFGVKKRREIHFDGNKEQETQQQESNSESSK